MSSEAVATDVEQMFDSDDLAQERQLKAALCEVMGRTGNSGIHQWIHLGA